MWIRNRKKKEEMGSASSIIINNTNSSSHTNNLSYINIIEKISFNSNDYNENILYYTLKIKEIKESINNDINDDNREKEKKKNKLEYLNLLIKRSFNYYLLEQYSLALNDCEIIIELYPFWFKGYFYYGKVFH